MEKQFTLVTGGAGFLGSHLCERLIERGRNIVCVDSLITGRMENIAHLMNLKSFQFIQHDIIEHLTFPSQIDEIYNLACPASPVKYELDPVHTFKTSVIGALNMLVLSLEKNARILQASTSEVYGDPGVSPQPETYWGNVNPFGPRSCYDVGKRAAETLFHDYHNQYGAKIKIARIFNTYGPQMDPEDGRVVSNFVVQALLGKDLTLYGTGEQTRSFCYVDDLVSGLMALMDAPLDVTGPINMGNPVEFTVRALADLILEKTGSKSGMIFNPLPVDDPKRRKPDISVAKDVLHWQPQTPLSEGLDKTIPYFAAQLGLGQKTDQKVS